MQSATKRVNEGSFYNQSSRSSVLLPTAEIILQAGEIGLADSGGAYGNRSGGAATHFTGS